MQHTDGTIAGGAQGLPAHRVQRECGTVCWQRGRCTRVDVATRGQPNLAIRGQSDHVWTRIGVRRASASSVNPRLHGAITNLVRIFQVEICCTWCSSSGAQNDVTKTPRFVRARPHTLCQILSTGYCREKQNPMEHHTSQPNNKIVERMSFMRVKPWPEW